MVELSQKVGDRLFWNCGPEADQCLICCGRVQLNGAACGDDDDASMNRRLTFYRLCDRLASRLQSLFVPLVGQIVKDVCRVLKQTNEGSNPSCHLSV